MRNAVLLLAVLLTGCDFDDFNSSNRFKEDFNYSFPLSPGGRIDLENFNGSVEITAWDKDAVEITGQKHASTEDLLEAIKIDIVPASDSIRIRTVRPAERRGNMGARYVLKVPARVNLERIVSSNGGIRISGIEGGARVRSSNGGVDVFGLKGNLEATTSNSSIDVTELDGSALLRTSNGRIRVDRVRGAFEAVTSNSNIDARLIQIDPSRPIRAETSNGNVHLQLDEMNNHQVRATSSNGSVTLKLPSNAAARVRASTSNGSITSDFDVSKTNASNSKTRLEGTIGAGGGTIDIGTSNGSIRLLKL